MGGTTIKIATRSSRLARVQTEEALAVIRTAFPDDTRFEVVPVTTPGDRDLTTPLTDPSIPDDFFTRDLDDMLRRGIADIGVHSAKDLPRRDVTGIHVAAHLPTLDPREALVCRTGLTDPSDVRVIGTSSPRREEAIRSLYPTASMKALRGTIDQRIEKLDAGEYDAIIVAACALHRLGLANRISQYLDWDSVPLQGRLAITARADDKATIEALKAIDVRRKAGLIAILGCPADVALLSVRAAQYIEHADVIFHDRLIPDDMLLRIHKRAIPVGKAGGSPSTPQSEIHRLMLHEAEKGNLVVRLHGGDPGIYGHLGEELEFITSWGLRCDVVNGPSAAQIASANSRSPLTHRGEGHRVTFVSARPTPGVDVPDLPGPKQGNIAMYMGVAAWQDLEAKFRKVGWPDSAPVVIAERLGYRDERIRSTTLGKVRDLEIDSPAIFLVGTRSFPEVPSTLFVGTDPDHFLKYGPLIHFPLIKLVSRPLAERAEYLAKELPTVRGLLFPSRFAVSSFMEALMTTWDARALGGKSLLAVGPATENELAHYGLRADGAADSLGGVHALASKLTPEFSGRYLYPCSDASPQQERVKALASHGIQLVPAVFYANREMEYASLPRRAFARVLFTSSTTVEAYFRQFPQELTTSRTWLAVGPSTARALSMKGLEAEVISDSSSMRKE